MKTPKAKKSKTEVTETVTPVVLTTEDVTFTVTFSSKWWLNPPKVKLMFDDTVLEEFVVEQEESKSESLKKTFTVKCTLGEHSIGILLYDKTDAETQIDKDGTILQDQILNIDAIEVQDISLGHYFYSGSNFYPDQAIRPDLPDIIPSLTGIGFNGKYEIKFSSPVFDWLIETL